LRGSFAAPFKGIADEPINRISYDIAPATPRARRWWRDAMRNNAEMTLDLAGGENIVLAVKADGLHRPCRI
jgi:hypothetical protein